MENSKDHKAAAEPPLDCLVMRGTDTEIDLARVRKLRAGDAAEIALLRKALSAMLTEMGMDENEYNKPTFDQARRALGA